MWSRRPAYAPGLSISKKIVEKMSGTIRVESEPGRGSVFLFFPPSGGE